MVRLIPLLVIALYGCAHLTKHETFYSEFCKYSESVRDSNMIENYARFFHPSLTAGIDINEPSTRSQLQFSKYMDKEVAHYEVLHGDIGCLTVDGTSAENNPVSFYVEYKKENDEWLISDVDVSFHEGVGEYKNEALCPSQTRVQ